MLRRIAVVLVALAGWMSAVAPTHAATNQPSPIGNNSNVLGDDPDTGTSVGYWISLAGPGTDKTLGDRYSAKTCPTTTYACQAATPNNKEYNSNGYAFTVHVGAVTGQPLVIEAWDPEFADVGDTCAEAAFPTADQLAALAQTSPAGSPPDGYYADAATRYAGGDSGAHRRWCSGDVEGGTQKAETTTFIVRAPDATPGDSFDNPVITTAECSPIQMPTYDLTTGPTIDQRLDPSDGVDDEDAVYDTTDNRLPGGLTFTEVFRRWVDVCTIQPEDLVTGDYVVQVRTNADVGTPLDYDPALATTGINRFSLRAGFGAGAADGSGVIVSAAGQVAIRDDAAVGLYPVGKVLPTRTKQKLHVTLFDAGDGALPVTFQLIGPNGAPWTNCHYRSSTRVVETASPCLLDDVTAAKGFNGQIITLRTAVPAKYRCDPSVVDGCTFYLKATAAGGIADSLTITSAVGTAT